MKSPNAISSPMRIFLPIFGFRGLAVRIEILSSAFGAKRLPVGYCRTALCTAPVFVCVDINAAAWAKALIVIERLAALGTCCGRIIISFHSLMNYIK